MWRGLPGFAWQCSFRTWAYAVARRCWLRRRRDAHRWAARHEAVRHLDDLLLRRTRIGILTRDGGRHLLARVRAICQPELAWSDERWDAEATAYLALCERHYGLPRDGR